MTSNNLKTHLLDLKKTFIVKDIKISSDVF